MKKEKKRLLITDWHILNNWEKGLALGAIIAALLLIPLSFVFNKQENIYILPLVFIIITLIVTFIFHYTRKK